MTPISHSHVQVYDVIGCGFGPSNLAIAVAFTEKWSECEDPGRLRRVLFIERHHEFLWHPGMLLPGTRMQISYLKDLTTLRRPTSPYSFLSYLHAHNRLVAFINRGSPLPTRREYADYLAWAADKVVEQGIDVVYSEDVVAIAEETSSNQEGGHDYIEITSRRTQDGTLFTRRTRNLILASGGSPRIPRPLMSLCTSNSQCVPLCIHTSSYTYSIGPLVDRLSSYGRPLKIAVVGGGQSAAEVTLDLLHRLSSIPVQGDVYGVHALDIIIKKGCLKPSDDSPFVNEIFDPEATDTTFALSSNDVRDAVRSEYSSTNYGVVNPKTLDALYEQIYEQKIDEGIARRSENFLSSRPWLTIRKYQSVLSSFNSQSTADTEEPPFTLTLQHVLTRSLSTAQYDAIVCGTGYERLAWLHLLRSSNLATRFGFDCTVGGSSDGLIRLVPEHTEEHAQIMHPEYTDDSDTEGSVSLTSSSFFSSTDTSLNTPPSSPGVTDPLSKTTTLRISRNYQLLPRASEDASRPFKGRIYLQGYTEATHGLSDTLLSVVSIRAGEVVDDIWNAERVSVHRTV